MDRHVYTKLNKKKKFVLCYFYFLNSYKWELLDSDHLDLKDDIQQSSIVQLEFITLRLGL